MNQTDKKGPEATRESVRSKAGQGHGDSSSCMRCVGHWKKNDADILEIFVHF